MTDIATRMIAERDRSHTVAIKALRMMQEHYGNPYFSFNCVTSAEEAEWRRNADALVAKVA
jgi:hypothetical protein